MSEKSQVYKCDVCSSMVHVLHGGAGTLVCCNQPMTLQAENTTDAATEKHVPVIERVENGIKVVVGSVNHPMEEKHYIEWIELNANGKNYRQFLKAGDKPEAMFHVYGNNEINVRAYCNLHGLWKA